MATKQFYATGDFRYGTRMLRAGDPVDMDGPNARLFLALKKISPNKPRTVTSLARPDADGSGNLLAPAIPVARVAKTEKVTVAKAPKRKAAPRKKRATAKK